MVTRRSPRGRDGGSILVLTLIMVTVMAVIVLALTQYVAVTLRTADVASERSETNSDSANVMHWAIEQLAKKRIQITDLPSPGSACADAPAYTLLAIPAGLVANGSTTTLECARTNPINGEPVVHLRARSVGDQVRVIEATVEVPQYSHGARVADWRVDIPIDVPPYTTTTSSTSTTTTTVATNNAPVAANMSVTVGRDDPPYPLALPVSDIEGDPMTVASVTPSGGQITVTAAAGTTVNVSATTAGSAVIGSSYTFTYTVTDGQPSNTGTVTVNVVAGPITPTTSTTTTTTPAPPVPACGFIVTSAQSGGNAGIGVLTVSNTGADFTGWQIQLAQKNSAKPWQFTWGAGVTATVGPAIVTVSGGQTVTQSSPFSVSANLVQSNGNPKIVVNDTLTCTVISP